MAQRTTHVFLGLLKTLLIILAKLTAITFAFTCKIAGMILLKVSEAIEKLLAR